MDHLNPGSPLGTATVRAIRDGDLGELSRLLTEHPGLAGTRIGDPDGESRTLLHIATDWPGHHPESPRVITLLAEAGADVHAPFAGPHAETPLHWAASNDDVPAMDALLAAGADIEAGGSVVDGGPPLSDAVAFGQWKAARRLVECGARVNLWQAAALGLTDRLRELVTTTPRPDGYELDNALWCACHGGQRETAEYLLGLGGRPNWIGHDGLTALDAARRAQAGDLADWLVQQGARTAADLG